MAKSSGGGLFSGGDPSLIAAAAKAGEALKPADLSKTFQGVATAYAASMEKIGAGYAAVAEVVAHHAAELYGEEISRKVQDFAENTWVDIKVALSPDSNYDKNEALQQPKPEIATYQSKLEGNVYDHKAVFEKEQDFWDKQIYRHTPAFKAGDLVEIGGTIKEIPKDWRTGRTLKDYVPPPPPAKDVNLDVGGVSEKHTFTNGKDYFGQILKPAREHQRAMEKEFGRGSAEAKEARDRYREMRGAWLTSTATFRQARETHGDSIANNTYDINSSGENVPFVRAILKEGKPMEDGSYVRMGANEAGEISFTWMDRNGQVKLKDDGTPWTTTRHDVNRLLVPKNAEVDASIIAQNKAALKAGTTPLYDAQGKLLNGIDNKQAFDTYHKNKHINGTINGVNDSGDPGMAYKYATHEKSSFATQNFAEAVSGVEFKDGKIVGNLTWINEEMWGSLQGVSSLDTDISGTVDAKDFATLENYNILKNHLLNHSPSSLSVFANWRAEEVGRKEYEDGQRRQKTKKEGGGGGGGEGGDYDPFPNMGVGGDFVFDPASGVQLDKKASKETFVGYLQDIEAGRKFNVGNSGFRWFPGDGWTIYNTAKTDKAGNPKVVESGVTSENLIQHKLKLDQPAFQNVGPGIGQKYKDTKAFQFTPAQANSIKESFGGARREKLLLEHIQSALKNIPDQAWLASKITRAGGKKKISFGGTTYDLKSKDQEQSFIDALERAINMKAGHVKKFDPNE